MGTLTEPNSKPFEIVVGVDASKHAGLAVEWVRGLVAKLPGPSKVTALGVIAARHRPPRSTLLAALRQAETKLKDTRAEVQTGILHGHPAEQLVEWAARHEANLLAVGAQGARPYLGIVGGVAQQVVEHARTPVLIVRRPYAEPKLVVAASDGSPSSRAAIEYLSMLPLPKSCRVEVVTVLPGKDEGEPGEADVGEGEAGPVSAAAEERLAVGSLTWGVDLLSTAGVAASAVELRGEPGPVLLGHLESQGADLIVAGSRGLSAVRGWLLGSVSRKLVYHAPCSVLIVKERADN